MFRIGHRGACGYEVENTLKSIQKALELHVNIIEIDVRRCASGELVIFHDKKVDRVTNGTGVIKKLSLAEIKQLRTLDGQQIITLSEALDFIAGRCIVNLHLKKRGLAKTIVEILHQYIATKKWSVRQFIISSFSHKELQRIKKLDKNIKVGILYYRHLLSILKRAQLISAYSVHLNRRLLKKKLITKLHQHHIKIFIWTINSAIDIRRARKLNVDGIISDFPDLI